MKKLFSFFLSLCLLLSMCSCLAVSVLADGSAIEVCEDGRARPSSAGQLQVLNGTLCSESGEPVILRGVSSYGLSMAESFINEPLFHELSHENGVNVFRLALYTWGVGVVGYCSGADKSRLDKVVEDGVNYARNQDMYAIIDWHVLQDKDPNVYLEDAKIFFADMASRFCDYNNVLYEICNEPNGVDWAAIRAYADVIIPIIRDRDPDAVIIVGTPSWSQELDKAVAEPLPYDNIMYTLHFYSASHKEELRAVAAEARRSGLPIFVTEYGVTAASGGLPRDLVEADRWIDFLESENISYCLWSFSKVPEACSCIKRNSLKYSGFTQEDLSPTGVWLFDTIASHNGMCGEAG